MAEKLIHLRGSVRSGGFRRENFEGAEHLVARVVMMVEGVHCGSGGPQYYTPDILSLFAEAWSGVPVPVYHPHDVNGDPMSCNNPDILETQNVGRMFNVRFEENVHGDLGGLVGEAWINVSRAEEVYPGLVDRIENGEVIEVSTGMYAVNDGVPGVWNEENYGGSVNDIRPDHLAILPDQQGACSTADGCGIRVNIEKSLLTANKAKGMGEKLSQYAINRVSFFLNEMGKVELLRQLQRLADEMDGPANGIHFVEEVYETNCIIRREGGQQPGTKYFRMAYEVNENGVASFAGQSEEVVRKVSYVARRTQTQNKGEETMAGKKDEQTANEGCCKEKIDAIIAHEATMFTEDDREHLEALPEVMLDKMLPVENTEEDPPPVENEEEAPVEEEVQALTSSDYIKNAPPEIGDVLMDAMAARNEKRKDLIDKITGNEHNMFSAQELAEKSTHELTMLAKLAFTPERENDFSLQGLSTRRGGTFTSKQKPLLIPTVNKAEEK
jgi:hypothetical protein